MHKRGLCRRAVSVRLAVTFVYCVETAKDTAVVGCCGMRIERLLSFAIRPSGRKSAIKLID